MQKSVSGVRKIKLFILKVSRLFQRKREREQYMQRPGVRGEDSVIALNNFSRVGRKIEGGGKRKDKNEVKVVPGWSLVSHINEFELYFKG